MKAVRIHEFGPPEALVYEDVDDPRPKDGEAIVKVVAAGVNHVEMDVRSGTSRMPLELPLIPGLEMSGEIVELRGRPAQQVKVGMAVAVAYTIPCMLCGYCLSGRDNVCRSRQTFGVSRPGSYAELVAVPFDALVPLPSTVDHRASAASQIAFSTAWHVLMTRAGLRAGQSVLVHAAGSGIGSAGIQVARLAGARVIVTSSSPEKLERARQWADETVDYSDDNWPDEVRDITGGNGVDVVMSHIGGKEFGGSLRAVCDDGVVVVVGGHSQEIVDLDLVSLFRRQIKVIGSSRATREEIALVLRLVGEGSLKPQINSVLPLSMAAQSHRILEGREAYGKVLLEPFAPPSSSEQVSVGASGG